MHHLYTVDYLLSIVMAADCYEWKHKFNEQQSGEYTVYIGRGKKRVQVYCDMESDGGGWTVCNLMFSSWYRNSLFLGLCNIVLTSKVLVWVIKVGHIFPHVWTFFVIVSNSPFP